MSGEEEGQVVVTRVGPDPHHVQGGAEGGPEAAALVGPEPPSLTLIVTVLLLLQV